MKPEDKILITGGAGMTGRHLAYLLNCRGYKNLAIISHDDYDLRSQHEVKMMYRIEKPDYVFHLAARVGSINWNKRCPAEFIYDNLAMNTNVIHQAYEHKVKKLLFCASAAIYPKNCPQPMSEDLIMTGALEPTTAPYALSKLAGVEMCISYRQQYGCDFITMLPTNLYGAFDRFNLDTAHVVPSIIRRFAEAKMENIQKLEMMGTGESKREFLYAADLADAMLFLMNNYSKPDPINIGGEELSIKALVELVKDISMFNGEIFWNSYFPEGVTRRKLDSGKLAELGWIPRTPIQTGIFETYRWFVQNYAYARR